MYKPLLLWFSISLWFTSVRAQEYRTFDGSQNNLSHPEWGATHQPLVRSMSNGYADSISAPGGLNRPNPRMISNALFDQSNSISDPRELSDYIWVFGQFIDHDVVATEGDPTEPANIAVDFDDPQFNPGGVIPGVVIPMFRSIASEGTGTDSNNPRNHSNELTAWVDGSAVYGSDFDRANWLRSFQGGKLKVSTGNLLPYNTTTGEFDGPVDPTAPFMADDVGFATRLFVAGDFRANEQPLLISCHTLFVREHNRLCEELALEHPAWNDEQLYQYARKMVGGILQAIVYEEWLPAMGVSLPAYTGYDDTVNGTITNVFSAAAFRLGHTLLNSTIQRLDSNGEILPEGNLTLQFGFFNPGSIPQVGGIDPYFKGMATQVQQDLDCKVINDVRNFLFGPPGSGGLDLAAININRGRERGLPHFNQIRVDLGLAAYNDFTELNPDTTVSNAMAALYDINDIDPWVGMLSEYHMPGALFGETIMKIMENQFGALRDGDRFYYQNDPMLTAEEKDEIKLTTFRMVIMRNTDIELMQANVFDAMPHDSICGVNGLDALIAGQVATEQGHSLEDVELELIDVENNSTQLLTDLTGEYSFEGLSSCNYYRVKPSLDVDDRNGVDILDIILLSRHLIGLEPITSPYRLIAGDVDNSRTLNTFDLIGMQKLLLFYDDAFPELDAWRFVPADYQFSNPLRPFDDDFPEFMLTDMLEETETFNFTAIKVGDINLDADLLNAQEAANDRNQAEAFRWLVEDRDFEAGEWVEVNLQASDLDKMLGYQFTLAYAADQLEWQEAEGVKHFALGKKAGNLHFLWNSYEEAGQDLHLQFQAKTAGRLSEVLRIDAQALQAQAYDQQLQPRPIELVFEGQEQLAEGLQLFQNQPNPFSEVSQIRFFSPEAGKHRLSIYSLNGQEVFQWAQELSAGTHQVDLQRSDLPAAGVYYYQLHSPSEVQTRKLNLVR